MCIPEALFRKMVVDVEVCLVIACLLTEGPAYKLPLTIGIHKGGEHYKT